MNTPKGEAVKEALRWAAFAAVSWLIAETLKQATLVPESQTLHVWVFSYALPVRELLVTGFTLVGRALDKYLFERSKDRISWANQGPKGLLPW